MIAPTHRSAEGGGIVAGVLDAVGGRGASLCAAITESFDFDSSGNLQDAAATESLLHCRCGGEDFEDRARSVADKRIRLRLYCFRGFGVEAVRATAAHCQYAVLVLAGCDDIHDGRGPVHVGSGVAYQCGLDGVLDVRLESGPDQVAAFVDFFAADARLGQVLQRVVAEESAVAGGDTSAWECIGFGEDAQGLGFGCPQLVGAFGMFSIIVSRTTFRRAVTPSTFVYG